MNAQLQSILTGTIGLDIAFAAAVVIARKRPVRAENAETAYRAALIAIGLQVAHFSEEFLTGFPQLFPPRLGLAPWTDTFFAVFNIFWIAVWAAAITALGRAPRLAGIALWFLALAAIANAIAHPVLAASDGGYFPGLITAIPLGIAGLWLARSLMRAALPSAETAP